MELKKIKVLELFGGICATSKALVNLDIPHETKYVEFDKMVVKVKNKLWNTNDTTIDVTTFETNEHYDLIVAGFPCQPFSNAGKKLGFDDPRGKLYKDTLRIIKTTNPTYVILENVKGILQEKNKWIVEEIKNELIQMGYNVDIQLINSKHFIAQNRERVFIIGSKKEIKDIEIDTNKKYLLKDYLDINIEPSYYYDLEKLLRIKSWNAQEKPLKKIVHPKSISTKTLTTRTQPGTASQQLVIDNLDFDTNTIDIEDYVVETENNIYWRQENNLPQTPSISEKENYFLINNDGVDRQMQRVFKPNKIMGTLTTSPHKIGFSGTSEDDFKELRIRPITPRESYRLMGWDDKWIDNVIELPKSNLYKTAGNSMVVPVMEYIIKRLNIKGDNLWN